MPSLHKLQADFARWMMGEDNPSLPALVASNGLSPNARLQIYQNIIFNNLTAALRTAYPAILKLTGENFFEAVAARYIREYPSESGNLQDYGAAFPECLAALPQAATPPYLKDVARLEWARQEAYLAVDARPLEPTALSDIPEQRQTELRMTLHPSVRLVESHYPILNIWGFCQQENAEQLTLGNAGQRALVWRTDRQISMQALAPAQYAFLRSLLELQPLTLAHERASQLEADFDMGRCLRWLFSMQLISGYSFV